MALPASPDRAYKRNSLLYVVRASGPDDYGYTSVASNLLLRASQNHHVAARSPYVLSQKIIAGHAALALHREELIGFGFCARWKDNTLSHSAMVVREDFRRHGVLRKLKRVLLDIGKKNFPGCDLISLNCSPAVTKVNREIGYQSCALSELSTDPEFWKGCQGCRFFGPVNRDDSDAEETPIGSKCCCKGMRLYRSS